MLSFSLCYLGYATPPFIEFFYFSQVYPGLMITSGLIHYVLNSLHITVHIRDVCVFLAPTFRYNDYVLCI